MGHNSRSKCAIHTAIALISVCLCAARPARSQPAAPSPIDNVRLDQRLGEFVPLDAAFRDESGNVIHLGDYLDSRPVLLVPAYYRCPMLCTLVINAVVDAVSDAGLRPGVDFHIVVFSIDPREQPTLAAEKKLNTLRRFGRNDTQSGWHFLTGERPEIDRVTTALGYGYVYDAPTDQYAHPAAVAVLTGDGRIARYLLGVRYASRDLRYALIEASGGNIGTVVDQVLLRCFHYDPATGRYGFAIMTALRLGGIATILGLFGTVGLLHWRKARKLNRVQIGEDPR
jgi:protein SCO1/2